MALPQTLQSLIHVLAAYRAENQLLSESSPDLDTARHENKTEMESLAMRLRECKRVLEEEETRITSRLKRRRHEMRDLRSMSTVLQTAQDDISQQGAKIETEKSIEEVIELRKQLLMFAKQQYPIAATTNGNGDDDDDDDVNDIEGGDFWDGVVAACGVTEPFDATKWETISGPGIVDFTDSEAPYVELLLQLGLIERVGPLPANKFKLVFEIFGEQVEDVDVSDDAFRV